MGSQCHPGALPGQKMWGGHTWRMRRARANNDGVGAEPPAESLPLVRGSGQRPPEAENLLAFVPKGSSQFASFFVFCKLPKPQVIVIHVEKLKMLSTKAWTILCINRKISLELQCL